MSIQKYSFCIYFVNYYTNCVKKDKIPIKEEGCYMLGNRIRELRKKRGLTQKQLAQKLNVSEQAIAGYEQNARRPNPDMLKDLANFFGVSVDYLLCNDNTSKTLSDATEDKELNQKILQMAQDEFDRTLFKKYGDLSDEKKKLVMAVINGIIEEASKED